MKKLQDTPALFRDPETGRQMIQMERITPWGYSDVHCCAIPSAFRQMDINNTVFVRESVVFIREAGIHLETELRLASIQINENLMTVMFHKAAQSGNIFSLLESICQ